MASVCSLPLPPSMSPSPCPHFCSKYVQLGTAACAPQPGNRHLLFTRPQGGEGVLPVPLPGLAPPPHVHRREWPENASPVCPDRMLPALGTSMAPAWCFQAIDAGAGPGRAAGGRAVGAACGRGQSDERDGRDEGPGVGPGRSPPRGVGEPPGRGLTGQEARRLCKRYWPSRPTVPGQHSGHFADEKTKSRMGLAPRCPAGNSTQPGRAGFLARALGGGWPRVPLAR